MSGAFPVGVVSMCVSKCLFLVLFSLHPTEFPNDPSLALVLAVSKIYSARIPSQSMGLTIGGPRTGLFVVELMID